MADWAGSGRGRGSEREEFVDGLAEIGGHLEGEFGGGDELVVFDGVDGLAGDADGIGQFLLGDAEDGALDTDVILHGWPPFPILFQSQQ